MLNIEGNETESSCTATEFFCPKSKQCIPIHWRCDGSFQCKQGDDEDFDLCKNDFPNNVATIECEESDRPKDFTTIIKAIPCNGIVECKDGRDENCDWPGWIIWVVLVIISTIMFCIWYYTHSLAIKECENLTFEQNQTRIYTTQCSGDSLVHLKVYLRHYYFLSLRNFKPEET